MSYKIVETAKLRQHTLERSRKNQTLQFYSVYKQGPVMAYINYPFFETVYENLKNLLKKLIATTVHT